MAGPLDLTLRQLSYVVAIADTLGFRRAAERAHVSQPALSAQIRHVENVLGVTLFERDKKRVHVTPAGAEIVARARRVLAEAADLTSSAERLGDPLAGALRLGIIPTVAPYLLPEVFRAVRDAHPALRLLLREEKTADCVAKLVAGELDAAIVALEADLGDLDHVTLASDPFVLATPPGHPLAKRKSVRLDELEGEEVLLLDDGHCFRDQALALCSRVGAKEMSFRATSLPTLAQMVSAGSGITLLPALAVPIENRASGMAISRLGRPVPARTIALVFRRSSPRAAGLRELAQTIAKAWPKGSSARPV